MWRMKLYRVSVEFIDGTDFAYRCDEYYRMDGMLELRLHEGMLQPEELVLVNLEYVKVFHAIKEPEEETA